MSDLYWRRADVLRVVDGDTVDFRVDLGYYAYTVQRMRLLGVDAPEMNNSDPAVRIAAQQSRAFVEEWVARTRDMSSGALWPCEVQSVKADSFGRWLAYVRSPVGILNDDLLTAGMAVVRLR